MPIKDSVRVDQLLIKLLKKNPRPEVYFSTIRDALPIEKSRELLLKIDQYPHLRRRLIGPLQPLRLPELSEAYPLRAIDLEHELKWARGYLLAHTKVLSDFVQNRHQFQGYLIRGESDQALNQLSLIESKFGFSLWTINCKISCLQLFEGFEAQKLYTQQIRESSKLILIPFIAHWISVRNEPTVSAARFQAEFFQLLGAIDEAKEPGLRAHLKYYILPNASCTTEEVAAILRHDFAHSLIDYYESLVTTAPTVIQAGSEAEKRQLATLLSKLYVHLQDNRLVPLLSALQVPLPQTDDCSEAVNTIYDLVLRGQIQAALSQLTHLMQVFPDDPWVLALAARIPGWDDNSANSADIPDKPELSSVSFYMKLIKQLSIIVDRGIAASHEYNELLKLSINFSPFTWTAAIDLILLEETNSYEPASGVAIALRMPTVALPTVRLMNLGKQQVQPVYTQSVNKPPLTAQKYIAGYLLSTLPADLPITREYQQLAAAEIAYTSENYVEAIRQANFLVTSTDASFQRKGFRLVVKTLLKSNELARACSVISKAYMLDTAHHGVLPIAEVVLQAIEPANYPHLSNQLALPIVLDIFAKHVNRSLESQLRYAFEDFLLAHNLERPSQLKNVLQQFDAEQLIYFLRNICVEAVMDVSPAFSSSRELTEERITVCRMLTKLDPKRTDEYQSEIKELVRRQVISKRMHEIEQSRIYVDVSRLKEWAQFELLENYARYIAFVEHGLDAESTALHVEAKQRVAESDIMGLLAISVPDNEPNVLFRRLVDALRDAYTTNAEFGLLRYLSTRVRHGALENELRKPLKAHWLITQREKVTDNYLPNTHWLSRLALDKDQVEQLNQAFANFSTAYDGLISFILTQWLQIRKNGQTAGFLDFTITDGELSLLASRVNQNTSFKQFVDSVVSHLDERLTGGLNKIQHHLATRAKVEARDLLTTLQNQVAAITWNVDSGELDGAINLARTEIQTVFDRVETWFNPSPLSTTTPYTIEDAVSVAEAIVQEASPQLTFSAPLQAEGSHITLPFQGGLPAMVDILLNIFDNVVRHSGSQQPVAQTYIKVVAGDNNLLTFHIRVTNEINPSSDLEDISKRLADIRQKLDAGNYESSITSEGGSGFFKIHRSLRDFYLVTQQYEPQLSFEVKNNNFVVSFCFPARLLEHDMETLQEVVH